MTYAQTLAALQKAEAELEDAFWAIGKIKKPDTVPGGEVTEADVAFQYECAEAKEIYLEKFNKVIELRRKKATLAKR